MAKYPKEKQQKEMEEDNKVHDSKSPEQILKELIDAYAKDKTVKKPVPSISQFEQGKFRRKTQPYQGEKPEKAQKSEKVEKNIGLPLMTSEKEEAKKAEDKKYPKKPASENIEAHMKRFKKDPSKYPGGKEQAVAIGISQAKEGTKEPMPKKELDKAWKISKETDSEKGVHKPAYWPYKNSGESRAGISSAGSSVRRSAIILPDEKSKKLKSAKQEHKKVLSELKSMPAPKLPKAELDKAGEMPAGAAKPKMPKMPSAPVMPSKQPMAAAQKQAQISASGKQMMPKMPKPPKTPKMATKSEEAVIKNEFIITETELNNKCTDCNKPQFTLTKNEHKFTPCICYASENQGKEPFVKLVKSEGSTKLYFNSKADPESVKSFLLTLKLGLLAKKISK